MFNSLVWLDSILLNVAQKFCDTFQRVTGFTKFRLEKWALIMILLSLCVVIIISPKPPLIFLGLVEVLFLSRLVNHAEQKERDFLKNNELRLPFWHSASSRISAGLLLLAVGMIVGLMLPAELFVAMSLCLTFFIVAIYLEACVPQPPSKSKMRQWYEKALTALNDSLKPEPALVPIPVPSR